MKKEFLIKTAQDTLAVLKNGEYKNLKGQVVSIKADVEFAVKNTKLYSPKDGDDLLETLKLENNFNTKFEVTAETTTKAVLRLAGEGYNTVALNFASAKHPGGGFLKGAPAQEESIARVSALYSCIEPLTEMYETNLKNKSCLYTDYMSYAPSVPIFKDDFGSLLDSPVNCAFITSPAVNAKEVRAHEQDKVKDIRPVMVKRIEKILAVALNHGHTSIVLGAFGCGVFGNRPADIAMIFRQILRSGKFKNQFEKVVFAVYDKTPTKENLNIFKNNFR